MKLVFLERKSIGMDIDISKMEDFGELTVYDDKLSEENLQRIRDAEVIIASKSRLDEATLSSAKDLKLICDFATGYDNVDIKYCRSRGITVTNVSDYSTSTVAQHTFALLLNLLEHISFYDDFVKSGKYEKHDSFSYYGNPFLELSGLTYGIAGLGNIGKRVASIAKAFGCRVIYYSTSGKNSNSEYEQVSFDKLLKESDIISLHCPLGPKTYHMMDREAFHKMKSSAILINVARGAVVDNEALYEALIKGEIASAGLDVVEGEPIRGDNPLTRIKDSGKLIITPHMAWGSVEARSRLLDMVYENIKAFIKGESLNVVS
ncbi:MAG: D-2-hydroxyacid dehydrogenase [Lachnospiraceae bacterium]|nr:D-2-hydroxyacid dehydrogenase [Lachnospiraceae bacterium]